MPTDLEPIVEHWYRHLDKGQIFKVIDVDDEGRVIEIQHFDGTVDQIEADEWADMEVEAAEEPEDWTGPLDDVERDDLDYTETDMTSTDWRRPAEDVRAAEEAWQSTAPENEHSERDERELQTEVLDMTETKWTRAEIDTFRRRLLEREEELHADIQRELRKCDSEHYSDLADRVSDPGERSVADLLVDVDLAEITRDVSEVRDIEQALLRLAQGNYGECVDCGVQIAPMRLRYTPSAMRCLACQARFERRASRPKYPTL